MNENKAVPNIRFNDFENKWEKKKLNQIVKKITRKNSKLQTSLSLTISAERGIINQNLFFNRQIASRDMSNYFLIKQGEFAYNKSYSKSAPFGTIKRLNRYNQGALSSLYIVFCPTKVNSDYLVSYFDSSYWYKQLSMISTEGVRNHGLLNVSPNDFFDMNLSIPYDDKEQQKIGNFFAKLDKLLDLQQQKIDKLELLKKALLQKLFPKHDAKIPELRFKEFKNEWEKEKLKGYIEKVSGNDGRMNLPTLTISAAKGWMNQNERFSNNIAGKEQKNYTLLKKGELSYNHGNSKLFKYGVVYELIDYDEALVPKVYHSFRVNSKASARFIEYLFRGKKVDRELRKLVTSGARMDGLLNINFNNFENIQLYFPEKAEQQKIGNLLSKVDQLIELENKKLQNFQQVKKCLLQNMFVE